MKLCTFEVRTALGRFERLGAVTPAGIVDLNSAARWTLARRGDCRPEALAAALVPPETRAFLEGADQSLEAARGALAAVQTELQTGRSLKGPNDEQVVFTPGEVKLLAPISKPRSVNGRVHGAVLGPGDDIRWPVYANALGVEPRLAAVIGRRARNVSAHEAMSCIAGFTILNLISATGEAGRSEPAVSIGPVIVTAAGALDSLNVAVRVNGETRVEARAAAMLSPFDKAIESLTLDGTLLPGDVLATGFAGVADANCWLKRGDNVELEIESIGVLLHRVL